MCSHKCDSLCNKNYLKFVMFRILKLIISVFRRLLNVTLCEFMWSILVITTVTLLYNSLLGKPIEYSQNPIILWWTEGFPETIEMRNCPNEVNCDIFFKRNATDIREVNAFLFYGSNINFDELPVPRKHDIIWGLYHEESPRNVEELMNENLLSLFNFSSTYSRYSDVPYPLQYLNSIDDVTSIKYFIKTSEKNKLLHEISPVLYLQSDCETSTERDDYVTELMKFINIDSYGACLNNKELPEQFKGDYLNNLDESEFLKFVARYKFVVAIENGVCEDYITEKFWRAIKVGTVPIYLGSPTITDWLPNKKSAILLNDFPTPEIMSKHLNKLLNNDHLYEEYLEHKTKQIITNEKLSDELLLRPYQNSPLLGVNTFECLVCKTLHDMRKGEKELHIVNKQHYNCPKPISALSLTVNLHNSWVYSWESAMKRAEKIYNKILTER